MSAVLWEENFNELAYGPNKEETVHPADNVWTNVPPTGWVKDDTHVPGYNNPDLPPPPLPDPPPDPLPGPGNEDNNGVTEWIGWTFADRDWWVQAAGDQRRVEFTKASGGLMVADNDEWDDAMHPPQATSPDDPKFQTEEDLYNAFITTGSIPLTGAKPGTYAFEFDSSWRPEGFDDGTEINNQTGIIEAIYSDGTTEEIIHWDSDPTGVFFHDHMPNEHVTVPLTIPAGATSVKFKLSELHSANDWWWAVDNLALTGAKDAPGAKLVGVTGNDGTPATNENLYNISYTTGGAPVTATQILHLPSVPDGDVIGFNPETGLLHHFSGGSSTENDPADPHYRDNHFMETIDVASGANTQKAIYNANSEQFGLTAPRPTFVLPATRRTDAQTDSSVRDDAGPGEYLLARDATWSDTEHAFLLADYNGIYKLTPGGQSTFIGDPALGGGEVSGLSFFRVNGQNLLFATQRDGPGLYILNPATGEYPTDPFIVTLPDGTPVGGILSLEPSADETTLLALAKDPADPTKVMLVQIDFGIETDNGSNDVKSASATPIGEFDVPIRDLAVVVPTSSGPLASAVSQVFVNGQGMTGQSSANGVAFRNLAGIDNTYGYPVPAGTAQTKSIPWSNGINKISLRFTQEVASQLQQADLVVRGSTNATYAVSGFTYDAATKTGTWTLTNAIVNDKVRLFLDDALVGGLDGEWQNANASEAYPSGDGTAGGDFDFRFNVLRGDANQDGAVNALDLGQLKAKLNRTATNPGTGTTGYSVFADLNADGQINALDLGIGKARLNTRLPSTDPASALLFSSQPISR